MGGSCCLHVTHYFNGPGQLVLVKSDRDPGARDDEMRVALGTTIARERPQNAKRGADSGLLDILFLNTAPRYTTTDMVGGMLATLSSRVFGLASSWSGLVKARYPRTQYSTTFLSIAVNTVQLGMAGMRRKAILP